MSKKEKLASLLESFGLLKLLEIAKFPGKCLFILAYHRILDIDPGLYPFDEELVSSSCETFDRQMEFVAKNFDVLSFSDLNEYLTAGKLPKRPLIITFDDGYRDNYTNAYPILKNYSLPATIFLTTGYIGRLDPFWFEKVACWIKHTKKKTFKVKADREYEYRLDGNRQKLIRSVQDLLKNVDETLHKDLMDQLESELDVQDVPIECAEQVETLSWEDIQEMSQNGIEFGSHSITHLSMSKISDHQLHREIFESKETIEKITGRIVLVFSYPIGEDYTFNEKTSALIQQAGYQFAVSYMHGVNRFENLNAYTFKRIRIERDQSFALFRNTLLLPELFI